MHWKYLLLTNPQGYGFPPRVVYSDWLRYPHGMGQLLFFWTKGAWYYRPSCRPKRCNRDHNASVPSNARATTGNQWWHGNWNQAPTWTARGGSNFDVSVTDDSAQHLQGLPSPAPWNVPAAEVQASTTLTWQEHGQAPDHSWATTSVTQSGGDKASNYHDDPWAHRPETQSEWQPRDYTKVYTKENQYYSEATQEDAPMEPARAEAAQTMHGHSGSSTVPVLPLHQLHPQPSLLSQLAGYQPPADDPMEVDPDAGQPVRKQAPSTPTDALVTDVDDADSEAPTQCTQNYSVTPRRSWGTLEEWQIQGCGTHPSCPKSRTPSTGARSGISNS